MPIVEHPVERATYTVRELADLLGISRDSAYRAVRKGSVPSVRVGSLYLIPRAAVAKLLDVAPANRRAEPGTSP